VLVVSLQELWLQQVEKVTLVFLLLRFEAFDLRCVHGILMLLCSLARDKLILDDCHVEIGVEACSVHSFESLFIGHAWGEVSITTANIPV